MAHYSITEASVVGLPDERYGEDVAAFLRGNGVPSAPLNSTEIASWVGETLGRHKVPKHIFWLGDEVVGVDFPKTGSGKVMKHVLKDIGVRALQKAPLKAKL